MKKIGIIVIGVCLIMALGAGVYAKTGNREKQKSTKKSPLATVIFVGYGNEEKDKKLPSLLKQYQIKKKQLKVITQTDDSEWYLIIPTKSKTKIKVQEVTLNHEGELEVTKEFGTVKKPVLLGCNVSDIIPSTKVTVTKGSRTIEFNPFLSLEDGNIAKIPEIDTKMAK